MSSRPADPHHSIGDTSANPALPTAPSPLTIAQLVDNIFTRFDANADAAISLTELLSVLDPTGTRTDVATQAAALLAEVDGNGDSSLSRAEVNTVVNQLDTNVDGRIDRSDQVGGGSDEGNDLLQLLLHGHGPQGEKSAPAARSIDAIVDALLTRFDADTDTSITLTELLGGMKADDDEHQGLTTLLTQIVADLDGNGDGSLDRVEITIAVTTLDVDQDGLVAFAEIGPAAAESASVDLVGLLTHHGHDLPDHGT